MGVDENRGAGQEPGLPSRQVPGQGGPPPPEGARGDTGSAQGGDTGSAQRGDTGSAQRAESIESTESTGRSVPEQRTRRGSGGVSDGWLITRMRGADPSATSEAYDELYRRHAEPVRRYARTCCRDGHTAEDLTNEVFARTLQAVRGGKGPETSVRAYLLTSVRHVAAAWARTRQREQLVDDFAVFAQSAASASATAEEETRDLGADVRAMREAEQTLVVQAFKSLSEYDQMVLWHTAVEGTKPQDVAPLLGKTKGATATAAHRARENLKQAYLQAHVSQALTTGGDCARFADRLGAYTRGGLRMRAERGLARHLEGCPACSRAALEVKDVNQHIRVLVPVALIGWFATAGGAKAFAALLTGGGAAAAASGAGAAAAAGGAGASAAGAGAAGGAAGAAGSGGAGGASGAAGGAASEGLGAPAKVGIGVGVAVAAGAVLAYALTGGDAEQPKEPQAKHPAPPAAQPPAEKPDPKPPAPKPPAPRPPEKKPPEKKPEPKPEPPAKKPAPKPPPTPRPKPPAPKPPPPGKPKPPPEKPAPEPPPPPPPEPAPPAPAEHQLNQLKWDVLDPEAKHKGPTVRAVGSSWMWQRWGLSTGDKRYGHGVTVNASSSVTIDLNRTCTRYEAVAGVDDMTIGPRAVRFSVYGDGARLWRSPVVRAGDTAVPVRVPLDGIRSIRLVVEPHDHEDRIALADWAQSQIACR